MTHRARKARESLLHWRNFATGLLIGSAIQTPVYAATDIIPTDWGARLAHGDWTTLLLVGSVVLLSIGLLLRIRVHGHAPEAAPSPDPQDSIDRYRPQIYRP
jgi:hypothetical protein